MMKRSLPLLQSVIALASLLLLGLISFAQNTFPVSGKVTGNNGQPLEGVTVQEAGTKNATVTDRDGSFAIRVSSGKAGLLFSSVGFEGRRVQLNQQSVITVTLRQSEASLNEVVVVGYGTQKKSDVTGSLVKISAATIQERPAQNVLQAMQGKAAGVQVSSNFKPGELPVLRVRGNRSMTASNEPLYVVDGIPLVNALGVNSFTMSDLNPNDIASIEILKDASATAIYGSRGANGVVLITTNKGKTGRVSVSYSTTVSLDQYKSLTHWMNGGEYIDRWRLSAINGRTYHSIPNNTDFTLSAVSWYPNPKDDSTLFGFSDATAIGSVMMGYARNTDGSVKMRPSTTAEQAMGWPASVPDYNSNNIRSHNWLKDAVRQGLTQSHNLSLTSGNDVSHLSMSLGYYDQLGVQRDQDYKRYSANISGDITVNKRFTLGTSIIGTFSAQNFGIQGPNTSNTGSKDLYSRASDQFPFAQPRDFSGAWVRNPGGNLSLWNPLIDIDQAINDRRSAAVLTSIFSELKFTPWLKYRVNFGVQYRHYRSGTWTGPDVTSHLTNKPNTAGFATEENFSWVVENLLYFDRTFAGIHKLGITLLQSAQKSRRESEAISVSGLINPLSLWYDLASNTSSNPGYGSSFTQNTLSSFMGRVNYTLLNKYLLTASFRADGASVLAPKHKWDYFPSFALAWKMQDEKFIRGISWINELKPRVGYGVTGNSAVNPYTWSGPLSRNPYVFGSLVGIGYLPQLVQNPDLGWEKTAQLNAGIDFNLLRNRLSGSLEWYRQDTYDLLLTRTLAAVSGYVSKLQNIGKTRNSGVEITLSGTPVQRGKFSWNVDLNWSRNKEEIISLLNGKQNIVANAWFIGQPLQVFYQYANAGIWGNSAKDLAEMAKFNANGTKFYPGTVKVVDQNGDYKIDGSDYVVLGTPRPKWSGGITNTFNYGGWSLSCFIYFRWGQTYFGGYPNSYGGVNPNGRVENNVWSWTNPGGRWPMPNSGNVSNYTSAMQYNNGSFGVVRNISLSYSFPKKLIGRVASSLALNFQVVNPFMFGPGVVKWGINPDDDTNWSIASSNTNPLGGTNNNTILPQSFVFGIRAGF